MASSDLASLSGYTMSSYTPSNPTAPPPPPKNSRPSPTSQSQTPIGRSISNGPSLLPPPPQALDQDAQQTIPQNRGETSVPKPPEVSEHWLPEGLLDKTTQQLEPILQNPDLLKALSQTHPSLHPDNSPLPPLLQQTQHLATHLSQQHSRLLSLRQCTQEHLLQLHALERQWRSKQAQLDRELAPWSAKSLYQGLREAEREGEDVSRSMESSWLDESGELGEREVGEWLKGWREGRVKVWKRREFRERWDEGRVGGWR
ncbi:MAG: hypothetical protein Q9217_003220 [Psora testacea]